MTAEWSGHPDPVDPDNYWIDDETGERIPADVEAARHVANDVPCVRCGHRRDDHDDTIGTACLVGVIDDDICKCIGFKAGAA